jgi:trehalose utilization protein
MPVVGSAEKANDTFVEQIVTSAKAAIDKAVELGVTDRDRVVVGGHSYGAFMTANLLAHSKLFRAGIARSGAYNRTLTPFGFQSERRTLWQAPEVYLKVSPLLHADRIKTPLLLIHGEADNNSGTFPMQSERLYQAVRGNGGTVRYVSLPHEAHGYAARESVEHVLAEMIAWADRHAKAVRKHQRDEREGRRRPGHPPGQAQAAEPIRVLVWDEQQPQQKQAYRNFLGNEIAEHLRGCKGLKVVSARQSDPNQGLSNEALEKCDVLIWWGHLRQREIKPELGKRIVQRIKQGKLSLIALHSAHWSMPFIESMNERAVEDALANLKPEQRKTARVIRIAPLSYTAPKRGAPLTPSVKQRSEDGKEVLEVRLPICCFPAYRADGKPSHVRTLLPKHPIAKGLPEKFTLPNTEMYDEPFHVPPPDEVVFEERWDRGERFRSGCVWRLGKGRVFYFRPGHETFGVYRRKEPLLILENAVRWLAGEQAR